VDTAHCGRMGGKHVDRCFHVVSKPYDDSQRNFSLSYRGAKVFERSATRTTKHESRAR